MNAEQNAFLQSVIPGAQAAQRKWGVPASVSVAQSILESSNQQGWGKSRLATVANNYFGIKAVHHTDPDTYIEVKTREYDHGRVETVMADFARYADLSASFDAHAQLLASASRYRPAMAVCHDPEAMCIELQKCGYSTNPSYAVTLAKIIHDYDLTQYDVPPEDPARAQEAAA